MLEALAGERFLTPSCIALVHLGLEEYEPALDTLERGYAVRDTHLTFLPIDTKWDPLRRHERFTALLRRMRFRSLSLLPGRIRLAHSLFGYFVCTMTKRR